MQNSALSVIKWFKRLKERPFNNSNRCRYRTTYSNISLSSFKPKDISEKRFIEISDVRVADGFCLEVWKKLLGVKAGHDFKNIPRIQSYSYQLMVNWWFGALCFGYLG